jgi:hypothetical protein
MQSTANHQPIFAGSVVTSTRQISDIISTPSPGSDQLLFLVTAEQDGMIIENIRIHYTNWGATEPANKLFLYTSVNQNSDERFCIGQTIIAENTATDSISAPINVALPPILYGDSKTALKLASGETLWAALAVASTSGFNLRVTGGSY